MKKLFILFAFAAFLIFPACEVIEEHSVKFTVFDEELNPVENAEIYIEGEEPLTTNVDGKAAIELREGDYSFDVSAEGFLPLTDQKFKLKEEDKELELALVSDIEVEEEEVEEEEVEEEEVEEEEE